jgi:hypothetical protein
MTVIFLEFGGPAAQSRPRSTPFVPFSSHKVAEIDPSRGVTLQDQGSHLFYLSPMTPPDPLLTYMCHTPASPLPHTPHTSPPITSTPPLISTTIYPKGVILLIPDTPLSFFCIFSAFIGDNVAWKAATLAGTCGWELERAVEDGSWRERRRRFSIKREYKQRTTRVTPLIFCV